MRTSFGSTFRDKSAINAQNQHNIEEIARDEIRIAELRLIEEINANLYCKRRKDFLEVSKYLLTGSTKNEANINEVNFLKILNIGLRQLVSELNFEKRMPKKVWLVM
ncbi:hypothetical protein KEM09_05140 [Carboxylicivirga mesophila]|uniref:Uncharacterized protein n=2 Tax=Carboxylicivirga TaxID=1628153 RepID=A0A941F535_9BACT|nr:MULTISPECIES: hypothetical protein [Carboxylicivirga]MBR8536093.1 hypothetical protein [Carboxylicivirga sediminis]MBS2210771.1 hypothetical protein [Carboxylicivirga mesophila]